jgi:heterotetrameric sarcosine oxidase delta subunit
VSFLIGCPLCGPRDVAEYRYGGEIQTRPAPGSAATDWSSYLYDRRNVAGVERAWWFHRAGCRRWFQADRDTRTNTVVSVDWILPAPVTGGGGDG